MITKEQQRWLEGLSNYPVTIVPYNPHIKVVFDKVKAELQEIIGKETKILHRGASGLGISGQGDLDIYTPIAQSDFNVLLSKLTRHLGNPDSHLPLRRARWNKQVDGITAEICMVNQKHPEYLKSTAFENYLRDHQDALKRYEQIKEEANGLPKREYYRRKLEFMNEIDGKIKNSW